MTVAALIERKGQFLLVQERIGDQSVYNQPAGHLEDNESFTEAVIRETLEETAWQFEPEVVTGIYHWRHPEKLTTFIRVTFAGRALFHDPLRELDNGIERALWLTPDALRAQPEKLRSPMVLRSIEDYLAGAAWPLSLLTTLE